MNCLCYCVCRHPGPEVTDALPGVGGYPVYQVVQGGLSAAVSKIAHQDLSFDLPQIKVYENVINICHRQGTVIPLRYGCVATEEAQIRQRLEECHGYYQTLLQELEGCVEMGLRILLPPGSWSAVIPAGSREAAGPAPDLGTPPARPGLAYLTARKTHYSHQDRWTRDYRQAADRCRTYLTGLFIKEKIEPPSPRLPLLSLYFLVPQTAVEPFRRAFRHLSRIEKARMLLSGPWPPYNFVSRGPNLF